MALAQTSHIVRVIPINSEESEAWRLSNYMFHSPSERFADNPEMMAEFLLATKKKHLHDPLGSWRGKFIAVDYNE